MKKERFFNLPSGETATLYQIKNGNVSANICDYGATLVKLLVPDAAGKLVDVVLGFENPEDYIKNGPFFGAVIGRYANRIANAKFVLDGMEYHLINNNNGASLHGGGAFSHRLWKFIAQTENSLTLALESPDMDCGFPGKMDVQIKYTILNDSLILDYQAVCDKRTVVNLTNHSYFNLAGKGTIARHTVKINADFYTPVSGVQYVPTGEISAVDDTVFDLRKPTLMADVLRKIDGYDHNFVLNTSAADCQSPAAEVYTDVTGIKLEYYTSEIAVQFYNANFLDGTIRLKGNVPDQKFGAFCLESQHYPDSPNHRNFPSTVLNPCETYHQKTIYKFSVLKNGK